MTNEADIKLENTEYRSLELIKPLPQGYEGIKVVVFDFDGTISTLRQGWEGIMEPLMVEMICKDVQPTREVIEEVRQYIDESTGIQTIFQMKWLCETVKRYGYNKEARDEWWYKNEYNERLLKMVRTRVDSLMDGKLSPEDFLIKGSKGFLQKLWGLGLHLYVASGTDHDDVVREVKALGVFDYFKDIAGAPKRKVSCSKEGVLKKLIEEKGFKRSELLVIGDGKVEIALGNEYGAVTLGAATDEVNRQGVNEVKRQRLLKAGCHGVVGDFLNYSEILKWLKLYTTQ